MSHWLKTVLLRCQATAEEARLARKRKSVDTAEMSWQQTHLKAGKDGGGAAGGPPGRGRLQAIADTIIGNLQFSITNVHIRYEVGAALLDVIASPARHGRSVHEGCGLMGMMRAGNYICQMCGEWNPQR